MGVFLAEKQENQLFPETDLYHLVSNIRIDFNKNMAN